MGIRIIGRFRPTGLIKAFVINDLFAPRPPFDGNAWYVNWGSGDSFNLQDETIGLRINSSAVQFTLVEQTENKWFDDWVVASAEDRFITMSTLASSEEAVQIVETPWFNTWGSAGTYIVAENTIGIRIQTSGILEGPVEFVGTISAYNWRAQNNKDITSALSIELLVNSSALVLQTAGITPAEISAYNWAPHRDNQITSAVAMEMRVNSSAEMLEFAGIEVTANSVYDWAPHIDNQITSALAMEMRINSSAEMTKIGDVSAKFFTAYNWAPHRDNQITSAAAVEMRVNSSAETVYTRVTATTITWFTDWSENGVRTQDIIRISAQTSAVAETADELTSARAWFDDWGVDEVWSLNANNLVINMTVSGVIVGDGLVDTGWYSDWGVDAVWTLPNNNLTIDMTDDGVIIANDIGGLNDWYEAWGSGGNWLLENNNLVFDMISSAEVTNLLITSSQPTNWEANWNGDVSAETVIVTSGVTQLVVDASSPPTIWLPEFTNGFE